MKTSLTVLLGCSVALGLTLSEPVRCEPTYERVVVISDAHYPSKLDPEQDRQRYTRSIADKQQALETINRWKAVRLVVWTGDLVARTGSASERDLAAHFLRQSRHPNVVIAGNHESFYSDTLRTDGRLSQADPMERQRKLAQFFDRFQPLGAIATRSLAGYFLIFVSADATDGAYGTAISQQTLAALESRLKAHANEPTLIFFHAPLAGTLAAYNSKVNTPSRTAQPQDALERLLQNHPQVLLWVSGHTHTKPKNPSFSSAVNCWHNRILNLHNPSWESRSLYTNMIDLYPEKIVLHTYDHTRGSTVGTLERTLPLPARGQLPDCPSVYSSPSAPPAR